MLPFMDFHTLYCRGPANRPSHRLGGVNTGFSNLREGLPTEERLLGEGTKMKTGINYRKKLPHTHLWRRTLMLWKRQKNKQEKRECCLVVVFFHITSMSEITLIHPVGYLGPGEVRQPWSQYGSVPGLLILQINKWAHWPTSWFQSPLKSFVIRTVATFSQATEMLLNFTSNMFMVPRTVLNPLSWKFRAIFAKKHIFDRWLTFSWNLWFSVWSWIQTRFEMKSSAFLPLVTPAADSWCS